MRKNERFFIIDTETANSVEHPLTYDIGFCVMDRKGNIYEQESLVVYDIYAKEREMMKSAYYAEKLPKYEIKLKSGERKMVSLFTAKKMITALMKKHNTNLVYAYNMNFDKRALNNTQRWTTAEKYRWFFPYGTEYRCIWHMACQVLLARPSYIKFAIKNNFISEKGNIKTSAECCYCYLINNPDFKEEHQGIDDVKIEAEILLKCFAQHKKVNSNPYTACWRMVQKKRLAMAV